ncbi:MAG: DUF933 domain-containing protein [Candidatus Xenobiia bacterium LiM19]
MNISVAGLTSSGKTTIFSAFTGTEIKAGTKQAVGIVHVPDPRIDRLAELFKPRKLVYANVDFRDTLPFDTPVKSEQVALSEAIRSSDALVPVIGAYRCASPEEVLSEMKKIRLDLVINDLDFVLKRIERLEREVRSAQDKALKEKEMELLRKLQPLLENEQFLHGLTLDRQEQGILAPYNLPTLKPLCFVVNHGENQDAAAVRQMVSMLETTLRELGDPSPVLPLNGQLEAEIALLPQGEKESFLKEYGITEPGQNKVIRTIYEMLDLISFFTVGEDECRAWRIVKGATALDAAATIHSDLARGFIRAEVIENDILLQLGSLQEGKKTGKLRLEGKTYEVKDGDIVHIMFNV